MVELPIDLEYFRLNLKALVEVRVLVCFQKLLPDSFILTAVLTALLQGEFPSPVPHTILLPACGRKHRGVLLYYVEDLGRRKLSGFMECVNKRAALPVTDEARFQRRSKRAASRAERSDVCVLRVCKL